MAKTQFSGTRHGFKFVNSFSLRLPIQYKLPLGGSIDLNDVTFGLCGGMCFAALDYLHAGLPLPDYKTPGEIDRKTLVYLCERQLDSLQIPVVLKIIEWMLVEDSSLATRMTRNEIPNLKRKLEKGEPVVLALIRVRGLGNPTHNHQVLATGYELDTASKDLTIFLYDPNHPHKETRLQLNVARPSQGLNLVQSSGEPLRGFFIVPYKPQKPPRLAPPAPAAVSFEAVPFRLHWPVDSRRVNQYFGENPDSYKPFGLPGHEGLDLYALSGANIYAAAAGEVYQAGFPKNHPYGLHVRIKHAVDGKTYHTIYGHLSEIFVQAGQTVTAGQRIGLADNTGNSFGSHLHLTLKIDGEKTPGYPAGIVDPWPYLQAAVPLPPDPALPDLPASGVTGFSTADLNLRASPSTTGQVIGAVPAGEQLAILGDASEACQKIGQQNQWLLVKTGAGKSGYVAAWFVQDNNQPFPPSDLVLYAIDLVNLRSGPGTGFDLLASLTMNDPLTVLGDASLAESRLGRSGEWIQVQTEKGVRGFVAAWLVHKTGQPVPPSGLEVYAAGTINVRARPAIDANILTVASPGEKLALLGDKDQARTKIGVADAWVSVQTAQKYTGYVAAWLVTLEPPGPNPQPVPPAVLSVFPSADVNLRAQPSQNSPRVSGAFRNEALTVIEPDLTAARGKIGKTGLWIYVQKQNGERGWAAAWFLSSAPASP